MKKKLINITLVLMILILSSCAMVVNQKPEDRNINKVYKDIDISYRARVNEILYGEGRGLCLAPKKYFENDIYGIIENGLDNTGVFDNINRVGEAKTYYSTNFNDGRNSGVYLDINITKIIDISVGGFAWAIFTAMIPPAVASDIRLEFKADIYKNGVRIGQYKNTSKYKLIVGISLIPFQPFFKSERKIQNELVVKMLKDMIDNMYSNGEFNKPEDNNREIRSDLLAKDTDVKIEESININIPISKINKKRYAIIIGIENYSKKLPDTRYANQDAIMVKEYAEKALGIQEENILFRLNEQATKSEFDKVFGKNGWIDKRVITGDEEIYFYYSGHGIPSIKEKETYLVPYDGDPNYIELTCYAVQDIYKSLNEIGIKNGLVILDACFTGVDREDGALMPNMRPIMISPTIKDKSQNIVSMLATNNYQAASYFEGHKQGLFTYFILDGMKGKADYNNNNEITIDELFNYAYANVNREALKMDKEQTPTIIGSNLDRVLVRLKK